MPSALQCHLILHSRLPQCSILQKTVDLFTILMRSYNWGLGITTNSSNIYLKSLKRNQFKPTTTPKIRAV
jgi:hypothetical protein